ncbi:MAG: uroporphyrinogen-III C-methyltransferase [Armatimonadota bacterium]
MYAGKVYLVGAGPGDPGLITLKGLECVRKAEVIVYDRLAHPAILAEARPDAELIYVGKASSAHTMKQDDINRVLVEKALEGKAVVRLKGGDPFVYGRGSEEAETLADAGIPFEIIPGITSAVAVPAYAGIPVTHRGICSAFGIVTGHEDPTKGESRIKWDKISTGLDTIVFLMGVENLPNIVSELVKHGRDASTPIALVRWGTRSEQETLVGTLEEIVEKVRSTGFKSPAVIIVGDVVRFRDKLRWFDNRPLFGRKVLVTRTRDQASALSELLRKYGAEPIEFPVIRVAPPASFAELDAALERAEEYDWLLFTSANGVRATADRLKELGGDIRWLKGPKIGAIGPKTAEALTDLSISVDFVPAEFVAESVVAQFPDDMQEKRILLLRAAEAREVLPEKLRERGARVDVVPAYRTLTEESDSVPVRELLASGEIRFVTFTSSSTVTNFLKLVGDTPISDNTKIACIGPITAQTARENGLEPEIVAEEYTIDGLVWAMADYACSKGEDR